MDKPKGFIHWTKERYVSYGPNIPGYLSIGRIEITGTGISMIIAGMIVPLFLLQVVLGLVFHGTVWWPSLAILGIGGAVILVFIGIGISAFFRELSHHVTINKPGGE